MLFVPLSLTLPDSSSAPVLAPDAALVVVVDDELELSLPQATSPLASRAGVTPIVTLRTGGLQEKRFCRPGRYGRAGRGDWSFPEPELRAPEPGQRGQAGGGFSMKALMLSTISGERIDRGNSPTSAAGSRWFSSRFTAARAAGPVRPMFARTSSTRASSSACGTTVPTSPIRPASSASI